MKLKQYLIEKKGQGKPMTFLRFGGLSKVNYKSIFGKETFHSPPAKKGIYAFIWPYMESFLWVWKLKHKDGESEADWKKRKNKYMKDNTKKFQYRGLLWCHFTEYILDGIRKGSWVQVHTDDLQKLLNKVKHDDRKALGSGVGIKDPYKTGLGGSMSKDHLEVFIEKVN